MNITKHKDNYLLKNAKGEYHLSIEDYDRLGEEKAIQFATNEIEKKYKAEYLESDIDFKRARKLGFCEYGIKDFCNQLKIDLDGTYSIKELHKKLTKKAFLSYSSECLKLFGKSVFDSFGGPVKFLDENRDRIVLNLTLTHVLSEQDTHRLACLFALDCVDNYEKEYPDDLRVRNAIESKLKWIDGVITDEELDAARSAAWSAAWSAANSAADAAWSAARSAAWSAANSAADAAADSAARSAAWSAANSTADAAWSAADSAALEKQINYTLEVLNKGEY